MVKSPFTYTTLASTNFKLSPFKRALSRTTVLKSLAYFFLSLSIAILLKFLHSNPSLFFILSVLPLWRFSTFVQVFFWTKGNFVHRQRWLHSCDWVPLKNLKLRGKRAHWRILGLRKLSLHNIRVVISKPHVSGILFIFRYATYSTLVEERNNACMSELILFILFRFCIDLFF